MSLRPEPTGGKPIAGRHNPRKPDNPTDHPAFTTGVNLLSEGLRPVVIYPPGFPRRGKGPALGKEPFGEKWGVKPVDKGTLAKDVRFFTAHGYEPGVGVCLGPGRAPDDGWLADVEGDGPEAEESRLKVFGGETIKTRGWGSTRGGHQLLRCDGKRLKAIVARLKPFQVEDANQPGVFKIPSLPGLELRIGGHKRDGTVKQLQSVVPPTPGTDGKPRQWNGVERIADAPDSFYKALETIADEVEAQARAGREKPAEPKADATAGNGPVFTATNSADSYLRTSLANAVKRIESKGPGDRRNSYRDEAFCLAGYLYYNERYGVGYTERELADTLKAARAIGVGPGDPVVETTVDEAIDAGKAAPRELKADVHQAAIGARRNGQPHEPSLDHQLANRPRTDLGNAERLAARHGADLRYCHPWERWLVWDRRRWKIDDTAEPRRRAKATIRAIFGEAKTVDDDEKRKALAAHGIDSEKRDRLSAMLYGAQAEKGIPILVKEMDTDPWAFNCLNGTIDLRTGELRPHRREDLITKLCPLDYDPDATCPLWLNTMATFFKRDDPAKQAELIDYWQRLCGYCLTGVIRDHIMPVAYGTGSNGKSTILGTMMDVFGPDYAMKCPPDMLMAKKTDTHPTDRADLFGKRLIVAIETEMGRRLNETMIKELTGGDTIRARRMREDFWEFKPTHTLIMATNHKPVIRGTDHGIWRRLKLVPFTVSLTDKQADKAMPSKLHAEYQGILAWSVRGCLEWKKLGLNPPDEVTEATKSYRQEQDMISAFLDECTDSGPRFEVKAGELYRAYAEWASARNEYVGTQSMFGVAIEERGIKKRKSSGILYLGIELKPVVPF